MPFDETERQIVQKQMANLELFTDKKQEYLSEQKDVFVKTLVNDGLTQHQVRLFLALKGAYCADV